MGTFDSLDEVKGYYVELPPGTDPEALVTHTTSLPVDNKLKLILHATNYGNLPVAAEVRELS